MDGTNRKFITTQYLDAKNKAAYSFFQVLHEGEGYTLYIRNRIKYFEESRVGAYSPAKPARFENMRPFFYLGTKSGIDEVLTYLPSKMKKFIQVFSDERAVKVNIFIKKNRPDLNSKEGLVEVLNTAY